MGVSWSFPCSEALTQNGWDLGPPARSAHATSNGLGLHGQSVRLSPGLSTVILPLLRNAVFWKPTHLGRTCVFIRLVICRCATKYPQYAQTSASYRECSAAHSLCSQECPRVLPGCPRPEFSAQVAAEMLPRAAVIPRLARS